jgi:hypothetical protein
VSASALGLSFNVHIQAIFWLLKRFRSKSGARKAKPVAPKIVLACIQKRYAMLAFWGELNIDHFVRMSLQGYSGDRKVWSRPGAANEPVFAPGRYAESERCAVGELNECVLAGRQAGNPNQAGRDFGGSLRCKDEQGEAHDNKCRHDPKRNAQGAFQCFE